MCGGARPAHALQHVNLLLVLFAGATLAMGARLRWDPSIYVPVRELLPFEYRVLAGALPSAGAALLALTHLGVAAATRPEKPRRSLLYMYAVLMTTAIALELALGGWVYSRVVAFVNSPQFEELQHIVATREHLEPLLQHLSRWHTIPSHLKELIEEAEEDLPWNGYVAAGAMAALLLLQVLGVVFSILATRKPTAKTKHHVYTNGFSTSRVSLVDSIRYSARAAAQNCKLVIVWLSLDRSSLSNRSNCSNRSNNSNRNLSPAVPQSPASVRSFRSMDKSDEWAPLKAKYKNGKIVPV